MALGLGSRQVTWPFLRRLCRGQGLCHAAASVLHFVINGRLASVRTGAAGGWVSGEAVSEAPPEAGAGWALGQADGVEMGRAGRQQGPEATEQKRSQVSE